MHSLFTGIATLGTIALLSSASLAAPHYMPYGYDTQEASAGAAPHGGGYVNRNHGYQNTYGNLVNRTTNIKKQQNNVWKPTWLSPTYKRQPVNFGKSSQEAKIEKMQEARKEAAIKGPNHVFNHNALTARLVNMGKKPKPVKRANNQPRVVLPRVAQGTYGMLHNAPPTRATTGTVRSQHSYGAGAQATTTGGQQGSGYYGDTMTYTNNGGMS